MYERLPNFCYWCGCLTHHSKDCSDKLNRKGAVHDANPQFGPWLRANTPNLAKKSVVRVPRYEEVDSSYRSAARFIVASSDGQVQLDIVADPG